MQLEMSDLVSILDRMRALEERVSQLEEALKSEEKGRKTPANRPPFPVGEVSEKYRRLAEYLYERWERRIELRYAEIEEILGFALPPTAHRLPQSYWANTKSHSYASGWLAVGYKVKIGKEKGVVVFERNLY